MINFGSAADKLVSFTAGLTGRYTGPPIEPLKPKSKGSRTPINPSKSPSWSRAYNNGKELAKMTFSNRGANRKHSKHSKFEDDMSVYEAFYADWDLIPPEREKIMPNWDKYESISDTVSHYPARTLDHLTRHGVVENMPTSPSPHDLAVLNILQKKLASWEESEEKLFERQKGWYCKSKHVEDRARTSWVKTQNRDFGSAVWRWLKLDDWDLAQSPEMKGLWHQAVYGDWKQHQKDLEVAPGNEDVLRNWKWYEGTDKPVAQKEFIEEAEFLGISPVNWRKSPNSETATLNLPSVKPKALIADSVVDKLCTVSRRLYSRSSPVATISGGKVESGTLEDTVGSQVRYHGTALVSKLLASVWMAWTQQPKRVGCKGKEIKRRHAREWNRTGM